MVFPKLGKSCNREWATGEIEREGCLVWKWLSDSQNPNEARKPKAFFWVSTNGITTTF